MATDERGTVDVVAADETPEIVELIRAAWPASRGHRWLYLVATDSPIDPAELSGSASVERTIAALAPDLAIPTPAALEQSRRNLLLRQGLLQEFGALTSKDIAEIAGSAATNRSQAAHALSRAGRIFSVVFRGTTYFPGFQFSGAGQPLPVIAEVLGPLRGRFASDWEVAIWFVSPNAWLGGARPVDLLADRPGEVADAARDGSDRGGF